MAVVPSTALSTAYVLMMHLIGSQKLNNVHMDLWEHSKHRVSQNA